MRERRIRLAIAVAFVAIIVLFYIMSRPQRFGVSLLADTEQIVPGQPFHIGVLVKLDRDAHIYWSNPGPAGGPTTIQLNLPKGLTAGEIQYPTPTMTVDPGNIKTFGYMNSVMFIATVTLDASFASAGPVDLSTTVSYTICKTTRAAGQTSASLQLPVVPAGAAVEAANEKLFSDWSAQIPTTSKTIHLINSEYSPTYGQVRIGYLVDQNYGIADVFPAANRDIDIEGSAGGGDCDMGAQVQDVQFDIKPRPRHILPSGKIPVVLGFDAYENNFTSFKRVGTIVVIDLDKLHPAPHYQPSTTMATTRP
jgi:DsbC/DsbD-like thiol-disulfide interchange protein